MPSPRKNKMVLPPKKESKEVPEIPHTNKWPWWMMKQDRARLLSTKPPKRTPTFSTLSSSSGFLSTQPTHMVLQPGSLSHRVPLNETRGGLCLPDVRNRLEGLPHPSSIPPPRQKTHTQTQEQTTTHKRKKRKQQKYKQPTPTQHKPIRNKIYGGA